MILEFLMIVLLFVLIHQISDLAQMNRSSRRLLLEVSYGVDWIMNFLESTAPPSPVARVAFYVIVDGIKQRMDKMKNMKDNQTLALSIEFDDAKGFPTGATPDSPPTWISMDETIATVQASDDGMGAVLSAIKPGVVKAQVTAIVAGQTYLGTSEDINVLPGDTVSVAVKAADPIDAPQA